MSLEFAGTADNWGRHVNPRIDAIIAEIPRATDTAKLVELYTEATRICLIDVPSFTLMYRPDPVETKKGGAVRRLFSYSKFFNSGLP